MSFGNPIQGIPNSNLGSNSGFTSGVNQNFYQGSKIAPSVNIPTHLPPSNISTSSFNSQNQTGKSKQKSLSSKFSFPKALVKVGSSIGGYLKRVGSAFMSFGGKSNKIKHSMHKIPAEQKPRAVESDPVIGTWPSDFESDDFESVDLIGDGKQNSLDNPNQNTISQGPPQSPLQATSQFQTQNPSNPFAGASNNTQSPDFQKLISAYNQSQLDQDNLSKWIQ